MTPIHRVGIVAKPRLDAIAVHLLELARWLDARGLESVLERETAALAGFGPDRRQATREELPRLVDLVLVLGGDGTLLSVADRVNQAGCDIPILGVNFGHLGFLTEVGWPELFGTLEEVLAGRATIDERTMLHAAVWRGPTQVELRAALNDVVITRGALSRLLEMSVSVGGEFVARFHADGLILSTPTGSTAYNLSAGGPILHPGLDAIALTPIAPHSLANRPVVIPADAEVVVQPLVTDPAQWVYLSIDGQSGVRLDPQDVVKVRRAGPARLIQASSRSYFDVLRQKLRWAER